MSSIDIVIPCYKYGKYLRECVQSLLTQGVEDLRILVIDDESPDDTPEVARQLVEEDSRVHYTRHQVNRGHIATYNEGIDWCEADYMLLLSADDFLLPGALGRAMALMDADDRVGLCFGEALERDTDGVERRMTVGADFRGRESLTMTGPDFIRLCAQNNSINIVPTPTALVRTSLLKKIGGYRSELPHSADIELWLRISAHASVGIVKADQALYRRHAGNMSNNYYEDNRISDMRQRQVAFDIFLEHAKTSLADAQALHAKLLQGLAQDAIKHANDAFNDNRKEHSDKLSELAMTTFPGVRKSVEWKILSLKKMLGFQVATALRPLAARIR